MDVPDILTNSHLLIATTGVRLSPPLTNLGLFLYHLGAFAASSLGPLAPLILPCSYNSSHSSYASGLSAYASSVSASSQVRLQHRSSIFSNSCNCKDLVQVPKKLPKLYSFFAAYSQNRKLFLNDAKKIKLETCFY